MQAFPGGTWKEVEQGACQQCGARGRIAEQKSRVAAVCLLPREAEIAFKNEFARLQQELYGV